jgi:hypothetical protein
MAPPTVDEAERRKSKELLVDDDCPGEYRVVRDTVAGCEDTAAVEAASLALTDS